MNIIMKKEIIINEQQEEEEEEDMMASLVGEGDNDDSTAVGNNSSPNLIVDYFEKLRSSHEGITCLEIVFDNARQSSTTILPPILSSAIMDDNTNHPIEEEPTQDGSSNNIDRLMTSSPRNILTPNLLLPLPSSSSSTTKQVEIVQHTPRTAHKLARWEGGSTTANPPTKAGSGEDRCSSSSSSTSYCLSSCLSLYNNQNTPPPMTMTMTMKKPMKQKYDTIPEIVFSGRSPSSQSSNGVVDSSSNDHHQGNSLNSLQHIIDDAILILS